MNTITVPRSNVKNTGVCHDVENFILDLIAAHPSECYHNKDLNRMVVKKFAHKYGDDLGYHVVRALDQFFANQLVKRVGPSLWQSIDGPDEIYSERASGFVPEGMGYQPRPANYTDNPTVASSRKRAIFNAEVRKTESSIGILKRCQLTKDQIVAKLLECTNFNPVAVRYVASYKLA